MIPKIAWAAAAAALLWGAAGPQSAPASRAAGSFPQHWIDGSDPKEPEFQVHEFADGFHILRQSIRTNFEGPFLYLIQGETRAFLLDSGAGNVDVPAAIRPLLEAWGAKHHKKPLPLVVAHSHGHGDHVAGDKALAATEGTTVVGRSPDEVKSFFGLAKWPEGSAELDLGGRVLDVLPIPGHQAAHIAVFDRKTGALLTGDTLYPGRLYIEDFATYRASVARLEAFAKGRSVSWILGAHVEMSDVPKKDFAMRAADHRGEHALGLRPEHLHQLSAGLESMKDDPKKLALEDFVIYPLPRKGR